MKTLRSFNVLCVIPCVLISGLAAEWAHATESSAPREINTDPDAIVTVGSYAGGSGFAPLGLCNAVKWADAVVHGTVNDRVTVEVVGTPEPGQDVVVSVHVAHAWMTPERDSLRIRILADAEAGPSSTKPRPFFGPGKECLFFLTMDDQGELVAGPGSATLPDTIVYWTLGAHPPSSSRVVGMVDSCAAMWNLPEILSQSGLVLEGKVRCCSGNRRSRSLQLDDMVVHKGVFEADTLRLVSNRKWGYPSLPSFRQGERVLLSLRGWGPSVSYTHLTLPTN